MNCIPSLIGMAWNRIAMACSSTAFYATWSSELRHKYSECNAQKKICLLRCSLKNSFPLLLCYLAVCCQTACGELAEPSSGRPVTQGIQIEHSRFDLTQEPYTDDTPGLLWRGGYIERDVILHQSDYGAMDRKRGGAIVEVIEHPKQYPYAIKDLFGTFRAVVLRKPSILRTPMADVTVVKGTVDEGKGKWRFTGWQLPSGSSVETICTLLREKNDIGPYEGLIGWYTRREETIITVMVRFTNLRGLPARLIDQYLKEYPSSLKESDFHGETWVADDIQKWIHLLQLHKSDKVMFGMALGRLAAYDKNFFGNRDAFLAANDGVRAGDTAAVDQAIETIRNRAEKWLRVRETK